MLSENTQDNTNREIEFLFERPIGWSSACLDSTINYYMNCNYQDTYIEEIPDIEQPKN